MSKHNKLPALSYIYICERCHKQWRDKQQNRRFCSRACSNMYRWHGPFGYTNWKENKTVANTIPINPNGDTQAEAINAHRRSVAAAKAYLAKNNTARSARRERRKDLALFIFIAVMFCASIALVIIAANDAIGAINSLPCPTIS